MGRKIRYQYLTGSLLQPLLQFTVRSDICVNPVADPKGTRMGQHMHQMALRIKPKFKGEGFVSTINYDLSVGTSYMLLQFVNGWKQGFILKDNNLQDLETHQRFLNRYIRMERSLQGYEDQYEDEEAR